MHYLLNKFLLLIFVLQFFSQGCTRNMEIKKLVSYPENYEKKSNKKWPLILFLHGIESPGLTSSLSIGEDIANSLY